MRKKVSVVVLIIGVVLIITGLFIKIPNKELTTYSSLSDKYSVIEEYVGGDAYNYIIGASLVGGEIAGAKVQKAVFISIGSLIFVIGLLAFSTLKEKSDKLNISNYPLNMESIIENKKIEVSTTNKTVDDNNSQIE